MADELMMEHPSSGVSGYTRAALDQAAICGRELIQLADRSGEKLTDAQEAEVIHAAVANGLGVLIHLTRAVVYAVSDVTEALPYAGRGN